MATESKPGSLVLRVPAGDAPAREGLELRVTRLPAEGGDRLLVGAGGGEAVLHLEARKGTFIFGYGDATLERAPAGRGEAFADALAQWVEVELSGERAGERAPAKVSWVLLGRRRDAWGIEWDAFKLFLRAGERYAEVFFRVTPSRTRAQFLEKWTHYRLALCEIVDGALAQAPPRRARPRPEPKPEPVGPRVLGVRGGLELDVPEGWRVTDLGAHWRLADAADEMAIEVSCMALPPLPPGAPTLEDRLRAALEAGAEDERGPPSPMARHERDGIGFVWSEYRWLARDTAHPAAPRRPARGRTLVCANDWCQGLVTASWWEEDAQRGEAAWDAVVRSIRLRGRTRPAAPDAEG